MKNLIKEALDAAFIKLNKAVPLTKKEIKEIPIEDVDPWGLTKFMIENDVPLDTQFSYDKWDNICLSWDVDVPTTEKDILDFKRKRFTNYAFQSVRELLLINNYKRVGYNSRLLNEFKDTTVYDMYMDKEFDRLAKYYSLPFTKS